MANEFVKLTRVYVKKGSKKNSEQTVYVRAASILAIRASNRLGYPAHRATVTLSSGRDMDVAQTAAQLKTALAIRA